jgi:hypothetical protein
MRQSPGGSSQPGRTVIRLLVCQEKIFSTGTVIGSVLLAGFPNACSCGGGELSSATRLGYRRRVRRTAPNSHADSGSPASQGQAAVPGSCPGRSRYSYVPKVAAIQKSDWLTPQRERPVRHGWRLGRIVRAITSLHSRVAVWRGSAGRGMAIGQARYALGQRYAEPAIVPRPTGRPRSLYATTAVEIVGGGRRPIKPSGYLDSPRPHLRSRCSPACSGSS